MYELLKYVHILAGMVWVGGAFYMQLVAIRAARSTDPEDLPRFGAEVEAIGAKVFPIASIVLLIAGITMVLQRWSFSQAWVAVALTLWVTSLLAGVLYIGPRAARVGKQFHAEGPSSVAARAGMARLFLVSRLELVSFAIIVYLMVFKPGA